MKNLRQVEFWKVRDQLSLIFYRYAAQYANTYVCIHPSALGEGEWIIISYLITYVILFRPVSIIGTTVWILHKGPTSCNVNSVAFLSLTLSVPLWVSTRWVRQCMHPPRDAGWPYLNSQDIKLSSTKLRCKVHTKEPKIDMENFWWSVICQMSTDKSAHRPVQHLILHQTVACDFPSQSYNCLDSHDVNTDLLQRPQVFTQWGILDRTYQLDDVVFSFLL